MEYVVWVIENDAAERTSSNQNYPTYRSTTTALSDRYPHGIGSLELPSPASLAQPPWPSLPGPAPTTNREGLRIASFPCIRHPQATRGACA